MSPNLALAATAVLIFWLFRRDLRLRELPSSALWIPAVWLAIVGSRAVSLWLAAFGLTSGTTDTLEGSLEGSPLDLVVFLGLMAASVVVLVRRGFNWGAFAATNKLLIVIYLFIAASALWSVIGFVSFKRAVKDFGHILPALVVLSEVDPLRAMRIIFVRVSYLLFPLSVVFIKYFPDIGRVPSRGGDAIFGGVTLHKNSLGATVFVLGLFLVIDLMEMRRRREGQEKTDEWIRYGMLAMGLWLLLKCESMTSLICLALGCVLLWGTGKLLRMGDPKQMLFCCFAAVLIFGILESAFDLSGMLLEALGRDRTLTGRTEIWQEVREQNTDPILGCGFYSFWTTEGAHMISKRFLGTLNSAHHGLLEMYLDGGAIGLVLLILLLLSWARTSVRRLLQGTVRGRLTLTFWLLAVMHNFSETGYFRFTPIWFAMLLLMIQCPPLRARVAQRSRYPSAKPVGGLRPA